MTGFDHGIDASQRQSLGERLTARMAQTPERSAIIAAGQRVSRGELDAQSDEVARGLSTALTGVSHPKVGLLCGNSIDKVVLLVGVLKADLCFVPLDARTDPVRLAQVLQAAACDLLLVDDEGLAAVQALDGRVRQACRVMRRGDMPTSTSSVAAHGADLEDTAYIIFTSGSTGHSKGVMVSWRALIAFCDAAISDFDFGPDDRVGVLQHFSFDYALMDLLPGLLAGATLVMVPPDLRDDPDGLNEFLIDHGVTIQTLLTAVYESFAELENPVLRKVLVGGEKMRHVVPRSYQLFNLYGPTETTVYVTSTEVTGQVGDVPIGRPVPRCDVLLVRGSDPVEPGEVGEICVVGDQVASGYLDDPEGTRTVFVPGPRPGSVMYRTGDLGYRDEDGLLHITGRLGGQVKHRGHRLELAELEGALSSVPGVHSAVVIRTERIDPALIAGFFTGQVDPRDAAAALREVLPEYALPDRLMRVERFPLSRTGKIDRRGLEELLDDPPAPTPGDDDDPLSSRLRQIWASLLHLRADDIGDHDDFTALGGHSILMLRMLREVKQSLGLTLALRDLLADPTIEGIRRLATDSGQVSSQQEVAPEPHRGDDPFPLTDMQQAYLVGRDRSIGALSQPTYVQVELTLRGYRRERFEQALRTLWARHEALSLRVTSDGRQYIATDASVPGPEELDARAMDRGQVSDALARYRREMSVERMRGPGDPLVDCAVIRTADDTAVAIFHFDGLVADGWSQGLFVQEFCALYDDPSVRLLECPVTFKDYTLHLDRLKSTPEYEADVQYWTQRVESFPSTPGIPLLEDPARVTNPDVGRITVTVPGSVWRSFERVSAQHRASAFMAAVTVFGRVIARFSSTRDFLLSIPDCARYRTDIDIDRLFGECATFFLLEFRDRPRTSFASMLHDVVDQFASAAEHGLVSGVEVTRAMARATGEVGNLAPIVFTSLLDNPIASSADVSMTRFETHTSQVWMDVIAVRGATDRVDFHWHFVRGLLDTEWVQDVAGLFTELVTALANSEDLWCRPFHVPLRPRDQIAADLVRGPIRELPSADIREMLMNSAREHADRSAVCTVERQWTYSELFTMASQLAEHLADAGVVAGDTVAITVDKGVEFVAAFVGVVLLGAVAVPIESGLRSDDVGQRLQAARVRFVVDEDVVRHGVASSGIGDTSVRFPKLFIEPPSSEPETLAVLFTSGTTGDPKAVAIPELGVRNCVLATIEEFGIGPGDRILAVTNQGHDMALFDVIGMLAAGGTMLMPSAGQGKDPQVWIELMSRHGLTVWNSVPALMEMVLLTMAANGTRPRNDLRVAILGGDRMPTTLPARIREWFGPQARIINVGGPTEATIWSIWHRVSEGDELRTRIPLGRALPNTSYEIVNENGELCPIGVPGEMVASGVNVSAGYVNDAAMTGQRFPVDTLTRGRHYRTGDIAAYLPTGEVDILGRADTQVKINGKRIELGAIEAVALRVLPISAAVAFLSHRRGRPGLGLRWVSEHSLDVRDVAEALDRALPDHMVPSDLGPIAQVPLTRNGKVDRNSPLLRVVNEVDSTVAGDPRTAEMCGLFADAMGAATVGPDDNFFKVGGDSISAIALQHLVATRFETSVGLGDIFAAPTPRLLYEAVLRDKGA